MSLRIAHANLRVKDPVASVRFYGVLGLEIVGCINLGPGYFLLYLGAPGDDRITLELTVNATADAAYDRSPGSGHVALAVGDLRALVRRLTDSGLGAPGEPMHPAGRADLLVAFVKDPDGHSLELIEGDFPTPQDPLPAVFAATLSP